MTCSQFFSKKPPSFYKMVMIVFGMSGGISFFTIATILMFRLTRANISPSIVGVFALAGIPYNIRFLGSFLIDHVRIPHLSTRFGQRKSWGIVAQVGSSIGFVLLGIKAPESHLMLTFVIAFGTAFFSAVQDIVSDAYRFNFMNRVPLVDSVPLQTVGFRIGQCFAQSFTPILASILGWSLAHMIIVGVKIFALVLVFLLEEPSGKWGKNSHKNKRKQVAEQLKHVVQKTISKPFLYFFLLSIILLRCVDTVIGPIQTIFLGTLGIGDLQFGSVKNGIGFFATMAGVLLAGYGVKRVNLLGLLACGAVFQGLTALLSLLLLGTTGLLLTLGGITIFQDLCQGFMNTLMILYISAFCEREINIYHFTMFSAVSSLSRTAFTGVISLLSNYLGWRFIFSIPILVDIPLIILLVYLMKSDLQLFSCSEILGKKEKCATLQ